MKWMCSLLLRSYTSMHVLGDVYLPGPFFQRWVWGFEDSSWVAEGMLLVSESMVAGNCCQLLAPTPMLIEGANSDTNWGFNVMGISTDFAMDSAAVPDRQPGVRLPYVCKLVSCSHTCVLGQTSVSSYCFCYLNPVGIHFSNILILFNPSAPSPHILPPAMPPITTHLSASSLPVGAHDSTL